MPTRIGFSDASGKRCEAQVAVEAVDTNQRLLEFLDGVNDPGGTTRAALEAGLAMTSILAAGDLTRLAVFRIGAGAALLGWLVVVREPGAVEVRLGPFRLFRASSERLRLIGGYSMCRAGGVAEADFVAAVAALLTDMRRRFLLVLQTVSPHDELARVADELRRSRLPRFETQYADQPKYAVKTADSFDGYLAQLHSKWRSTFRRSLRNFDSHFEGQTELRCFTREDEVTAFFEDAEKVSRRTWQWHEPGRGMQNRAAVEARLRLAAQRGYFCSFMLYGRGEPMAFVEGFLAGGCYIPFQIGYVQEQADLSVGTVCQMRLLRFLHELPVPQRPRLVDYMDGNDDWKRSMSNVKTVETSYRALPAGLTWGFAMLLLRTIGFTSQLKRLLRKAPQPAIPAGHTS
jgi:CelD/BcsL family acetyltransferase involved in cellulose biosynthesis